ncbi:MAG: thymidine phosphorylase family protein [Alcanivorax sp.]|nr:thymidine phosphorylase family protein [Alcanivorax sp.]
MSEQQLPDGEYTLNVVDIGIDTHQEPVAFLREDSHVCSAEGFSANTRIELTAGSHRILATLNIVDRSLLPQGHVGLSKIAMAQLDAEPGEVVTIGHAPVLESLAALRKKIYGGVLSDNELNAIIGDISSHQYRDIEIASFLSVCAGNRLNTAEIVSLTNAMVHSGKRLNWPGHDKVFDKHCIGGVPGYRTTPLVVSIVSAAGHLMPKTSSRAITSPAGTADTMDTLTQVNLHLEEIRQVVNTTGACLVWGGAVNLSPADDLMIRIEHALDIDGEGQLVASVLSKKIAAGSTHVLIDIPVGETVKVRSQAAGRRLAALFVKVGQACGITVRCVLTDGSRPVGHGIGPVEEARDLLAVLQCQPGAPRDLRERSLALAAQLLDFAEGGGLTAAREKAVAILESGDAWQQFQRIIQAQGGLKPLPEAGFQYQQPAGVCGRIAAIDNRRLARLAKLAGAPFSPSAGLRLNVNVGDRVEPDTVLFSLFSETRGEQHYALEYYAGNRDMFRLQAAQEGESP